MSKRAAPSSTQFPASCIVEVAWEVCNQVGGIYTVIRSKAPCMVENATGPYCMVGPYVKRIRLEKMGHHEPMDFLFKQDMLILKLVQNFESFYIQTVRDHDFGFALQQVLAFAGGYFADGAQHMCSIRA